MSHSLIIENPESIQDAIPCLRSGSRAKVPTRSSGERRAAVLYPLRSISRIYLPAWVIPVIASIPHTLRSGSQARIPTRSSGERRAEVLYPLRASSKVITPIFSTPIELTLPSFESGSYGIRPSATGGDGLSERLDITGTLPMLTGQWSLPTHSLDITGTLPVLTGTLFGGGAITGTLSMLTGQWNLRRHISFLIGTLPMLTGAITVVQSTHMQPDQAVYQLTLTGVDDDLPAIIIPMVNFSATMRDGQSSYLAATIPNPLEWEPKIQARPSAQLLVSIMIARGGIVVESGVIADGSMHSYRYDTGNRSASGTIVAYKTESSTKSREIELQGTDYIGKQADGKKSWRGQVNSDLRPGDLAVYPSGSMQVGHINYTVSPQQATMQITEA